MARKLPAAPPDRGEERLHKRIAASGLCSRRAAEELIREGRVTVNGDLVVEMGRKVSSDDDIRVDGRSIGIAKAYTLAMNKPKGVLTTLRDPQGRRTVAEFLPQLGVQLKPVGRLDQDTEGLLLFTNDGDLANRLMHPRYGIEKEYIVVVEGEPDLKTLDKLRKGVYIEGGKTLPAVVEASKHSASEFKMTIHEGRKRQIRLMCLAIGHPVKGLKRIRIGSIRVQNIPRGTCRMLGKVEVEALRKAVGLTVSD